MTVRLELLFDRLDVWLAVLLLDQLACLRTPNVFAHAPVRPFGKNVAKPRNVLRSRQRRRLCFSIEGD